MSVVEALDRELRGMGAVGGSALAASARVLALALDDPDTSATARANCARQLADTLERLRALAPPAEVKDGVDELTSRRQRRVSRGAGSAG